ncbi:MAG: methyltransferase domain-containing protein [Acidobacteria bacterium]|nr:methyltransferase domain-containing protein [Acidobacteriota bacterium]
MVPLRKRMPSGRARAAHRRAPSESLSEYGLFFQQSLKSLRSTASLFPSSRFLTAALLEPVDFHSARILVELGSGTGAVTREILRRLAPDGRLYALDINGSFIRHLRRSYRDPRLLPLRANAEDLQALLSRHGVRHVHAIISSLGLTGMHPEQRTRIVGQAWACLVPGGVMTQYQYVHAIAGYPQLSKLRFHRFREGQFLRGLFREVGAQPVFLNLPPALVFTCRK